MTESINEQTYSDRNEWYRIIDEFEKRISTRFDAGDKAIQLINENQNRLPTLLDREIKHIREIVDGVSSMTIERFTSLEILTDKLSVANNTALTAALAAAEKAVIEQNRSSSLAITKSEQGMLEALKQLQSHFQTEIRAMTAVMAVMQSRLDRGEGVTIQQRDQIKTTQGSNNNIIAIVACGIAALAVVVSVVLSLTPHLSH